MSSSNELIIRILQGQWPNVGFGSDDLDWVIGLLSLCGVHNEARIKIQWKEVARLHIQGNGMQRDQEPNSKYLETSTTLLLGTKYLGTRRLVPGTWYRVLRTK